MGEVGHVRRTSGTSAAGAEDELPMLDEWNAENACELPMWEASSAAAVPAAAVLLSLGSQGQVETGGRGFIASRSRVTRAVLL